jgi:selT/selW/selH-like putative selenoprotein
LAAEIVQAFPAVLGHKHPIEAITLIPSDKGRFEVTVDGDLIFSKAKEGRHTSPAEVISILKPRILSS